jgi:hypothetical protein
MNKREKVQKKREQEIQKLELEIRLEEEKYSVSQNSVRSGLNNSKHKRNHHDQKTKGSNAEYNDETSKGSLIKPNKQFETSKEDEVFHSNQEEESKTDNNDNELEFRITSSSNWKIKEKNEDETFKTFVDVKIEKDFPHPKIIDSKKTTKNYKHKRTDLQIIDDVSESKELSQKGFESFNKNSKISSFKQLNKLKNSKNFNSNRNSDQVLGKNDFNNSGILKSCSENISQIMEQSFKDYNRNDQNVVQRNIDDQFYITKNKNR